MAESNLLIQSFPFVLLTTSLAGKLLGLVLFVIVAAILGLLCDLISSLFNFKR